MEILLRAVTEKRYTKWTVHYYALQCMNWLEIFTSNNSWKLSNDNIKLYRKLCIYRKLKNAKI